MDVAAVVDEGQGVGGDGIPGARTGEAEAGLDVGVLLVRVRDVVVSARHLGVVIRGVGVQVLQGADLLGLALRLGLRGPDEGRGEHEGVEVAAGVGADRERPVEIEVQARVRRRRVHGGADGCLGGALDEVDPHRDPESQGIALDHPAHQGHLIGLVIGLDRERAAADLGARRHRGAGDLGQLHQGEGAGEGQARALAAGLREDQIPDPALGDHLGGRRIDQGPRADASLGGVIHQEHRYRGPEPAVRALGAHGVEGGQGIALLLQLVEVGELEVQVEDTGHVDRAHVGPRVDPDPLIRAVVGRVRTLIDARAVVDLGHRAVVEQQHVHRAGDADGLPVAHRAAPGVEQLALQAELLVEQGADGGGALEIGAAVELTDIGEDGVVELGTHVDGAHGVEGRPGAHPGRHVVVPVADDDRHREGVVLELVVALTHGGLGGRLHPMGGARIHGDVAARAQGGVGGHQGLDRVLTPGIGQGASDTQLPVAEQVAVAGVLAQVAVGTGQDGRQDVGHLALEQGVLHQGVAAGARHRRRGVRRRQAGAHVDARERLQPVGGIPGQGGIEIQGGLGVEVDGPPGECVGTARRQLELGRVAGVGDGPVDPVGL